MNKFCKFSGFVFSCIWLVSIFSGCSEPDSPKDPVFLLKTAYVTISASDFEAELDLKRAAYPYNLNENPDEYNEMVIHLVEILSEEIVLLSEAARQNIVITDEEIAAAEKAFRADYPEDSFEQMLLTNAIPYSFWKKRFVQDLIIKALIDRTLEGKIEIGSEDIVRFYEDIKEKRRSEDTAFPEGKSDHPDNQEQVEAQMDETQLISRLRMQKTREYYSTWLVSLWKQHPVEMNKEMLKTFLIDNESVEDN